MSLDNTFENLHFDQLINVIGKRYCADTFPMHWHKYVEIVAFPEDANYKQPAIIQVNNTVYTMKPGDIIMVWPGALHEYLGNPDEAIVILQFQPSLCTELPDFAPYLNLFRTIEQISPDSQPGLAQNMMQSICRIVDIQEQKQPFHGVEAVINLYDMFMELGIYINNTILKGTSAKETRTSQFFEKITLACSYIADNCRQTLRLEEVADYAGFSPCYFSRIFKQATGCSYVDYLNLQRLKHAQSLLSDTNLTITEISFQSGFKSISTFNRIFLQHEGCSPREYRRYYQHS